MIRNASKLFNAMDSASVFIFLWVAISTKTTYVLDGVTLCSNLRQCWKTPVGNCHMHRPDVLTLQDPRHGPLCHEASRRTGCAHLPFLQLYSHGCPFISHLCFYPCCTLIINFLFYSTKIPLERMTCLQPLWNAEHNKITFKPMTPCLVSSDDKDPTNLCTHQSSEMATLLTVQ